MRANTILLPPFSCLERRLRELTSVPAVGKPANSPLTTLLSSRHVLGIRHTHSATALGGAHPRVYSPECVEEEFSEVCLQDPAYPRSYRVKEQPIDPVRHRELSTTCSGAA